MSSNFPLKELAIVGATTIGVCCLIGWLTGAENLDQKKKKGPQRSGEQPSECDVFINLAEGAMKKGALEDAIVAYSKALELAEANTEDPRLALYPLYIHRRLVEVYEKMEKPKEALIHLQECISFLEQNKSPATDELMALLTLLEQAVDLCTLSQAPRAVQEKLLHKWLAVAKQLQNVEYIVMAQMLLGRVNYLQDKLPEAEGFLRQVIESYTDPKAREDLWLNAMTTLLDCSTRLEKPEQAKECITQLADYHLENKFDKKALETLGDRCVYLGYYDEAEHILRATLKLLKTKGFPAIEHAQVDYNLAVVWSATGRLDIAREKINEMKEYLRTAPNSLIPSRSKFLHTQGAKHESDTTTIYLKRSPLLKTGSVLVVRFENPELETAFSEIEYIVKETDEVIKIAAPYNYANFLGQLSSAEVTIFTGEDKTIPLGTHFVFISSADTLPSQQSNPVSVANILASETLREQIDASIFFFSPHLFLGFAIFRADRI